MNCKGVTQLLRFSMSEKHSNRSVYFLSSENKQQQQQPKDIGHPCSCSCLFLVFLSIQSGLSGLIDTTSGMFAHQTAREWP